MPPPPLRTPCAHPITNIGNIVSSWNSSFSGFDGIKAGPSILDLIAFSTENRGPIFPENALAPAAPSQDRQQPPQPPQPPHLQLRQAQPRQTANNNDDFLQGTADVFLIKEMERGAD